MDLIAISYNNIGPFKDQPITVNFRAGKYLIKAPIGSGKSFLFFDGPVFALYKYANRQILHRMAKQGFVHLLFEEAEQYWLIERTLKPTKTGGESVQSRLYHYQPTDDRLIDPLAQQGNDQIISYGVDIKESIKDSLEEVPFTNQKELDAHLADLLPPKEVALSVHFLMQDAENVFELQPAQRVQVFKHLFGLVGIDHAKEILSNKRKELQTTIKVKGDTQQSSLKLRSSIQSLTDITQTLQEVDPLPESMKEIIEKIAGQSFFADSTLIKEQVQIDQFSIDDIDLSLFTSLLDEVAKHKAASAGLQGKIDQLEQTLSSGESDAETLNEQIAVHQHEYEVLSKKLSAIDTTKLLELKKQSKELETHQQQLVGSIDLSMFQSLGYNSSSLLEVAGILDQLTSEGSTLKAELETVNLKLTQLDKDQQTAIKRKDQLQEQLDALTKDYDSETQFYCDKIKGDCPYVELIKGKGLEALQRQQQKLREQLHEISIEKDEKATQSLDQQKTRLQERLTKIKTIFDSVDWKSIKKAALDYQATQQELIVIAKQLSEWERIIEEQATAKEQQTKLQATIETKQEQLMQLTTKQGGSKKLLEDYRQEFSRLHLDQIVRVEKGVVILQSGLETIAHLIATHKENQLLIHKLQEQEQMAKDLYNIFSKELMVVVLQDFLPVLEQVINTNLAQMVDYEIRFTVPEGSEEKMELDITVIDQHGEREIKSLSGGQKAIVKIAWILAVSVLMKSKFLLLDETITSMDIFTVAKVADVLENFIKSQQMKFYVVTHSQQIQEMAIWDRTVEVGVA